MPDYPRYPYPLKPACCRDHRLEQQSDILIYCRACGRSYANVDGQWVLRPDLKRCECRSENLMRGPEKIYCISCGRMYTRDGASWKTEVPAKLREVRLDNEQWVQLSRLATERRITTDEAANLLIKRALTDIELEKALG
jgi:hypothetical protein